MSARFGWRLSRRRDGNGALVFEWRCPQCAERARARSGRRRALDPSAIASTRTDPDPAEALRELIAASRERRAEMAVSRERRDDAVRRAEEALASLRRKPEAAPDEKANKVADDLEHVLAEIRKRDL